MHFSDHDPECVPCARQHVKSGVSAMDRTLPCSSPTIWLSSCNLGDSWGGAISQRRQGSIRKRRSPFEREHSGCALQGSREMERNAWTFRAFSPERSGLCLSWRPSHRQSQRPAANAPWKEHVSSRHSVFPIQDYFSAFYKIFNNWIWGERRKMLQNLFLFHFLKALHCLGIMELGITKTPDGVSRKNRELNWGKTRIAVMERYFKILKLEKSNNLKHFLVTKELRIPWAKGRQQLLPSDEDFLYLHTCSWFT